MKLSTTILISSAGRRNQLIECFRQDADALEMGLRCIAADLNPALSSACQSADQAVEIPRCSSTAEFIPAMLRICQREDVKLLIPTIDTELTVLSRHQGDFAAIGTRVVISAPAAVGLARDKLLTARTLAAVGIATPRTLTWEDFVRDPSQLSEPVIAKPVGGSSSVGVIRAERTSNLPDLTERGYLVQELWQGKEYTVNVFFGESGRFLCAVPHERIETRGGEVSKGVTRRVPVLEEAARKLAAALPGARGPLCFQAIVKDSGEYAVFEINARFGGGYPLAHRAGARFSQWLLEEAAGLPCSANNEWKEGVTMLRYDSAVFLND